MLLIVADNITIFKILKTEDYMKGNQHLGKGPRNFAIDQQVILLVKHINIPMSGDF
jgi:hypothetical protein